MNDTPSNVPPHVAPHPAAGSGVCVRGVRQEFAGGVVALEGIDLDVPAGQFVAILGPSGCGKSTLLRLVAGLDRPTAGTVDVSRPTDGRTAGGLAYYGHRFDVAYVFQDAHLLPWRTVLGNTILPLELRRVGRAERAAAATDALRRVGLADAVGRYPAQLSGGMRMRVSLARALVTRPSLLLLDEPFAALDEITRQDLDEQLRALWRGSGMTVVFVTHSIAEAVFLAKRVVVMSRRPGRVVADRAVDLPADRKAELRGTARFAEQTAALYADLREHQP